ncbi:hypothetical protein NL676_011738 [Syzygium grande]|nr:hypothetical protein NL676_011738 [Syzygium grande]
MQESKPGRRRNRTGARGGIVQVLVGVGIDAGDGARVVAVLAQPAGQIRIHREAPAFALAGVLHPFYSKRPVAPAGDELSLIQKKSLQTSARVLRPKAAATRSRSPGRLWSARLLGS